MIGTSVHRGLKLTSIFSNKKNQVSVIKQILDKWMILLILTWNEVKDSRKIPKTDVSMQKKAQIFSFTITFQQMDSQRLWSIGWTDKSKVIFLKQHFLSSSFSLGSQCCFILIPFLYLLYETWLSMTFPKFLLEILWVKFCLKWLCRYGNHAAKT